jgi:DegV family protein with EDD domain
MGSACIITDNSAQFSSPGFFDNQGLKILEHKFAYSTDDSKYHLDLKVIDFPRFTSNNFTPSISAPSIESIQDCLAENLSVYDDIFFITISKEISPFFSLVEKVAKTLHGHANLHLIDSMNTSLGLGLITQYASELIKKGLSGVDVEKSLRLIIPHVYTLLCTPNLSYLYSAGYLDKGQALIGEMLSLSPLFLVEEGVLNPLQKVKNYHNAVDYFIEFVDEFEKLKHVAVIQPVRPTISETRILHQHIDEFFPDAVFSEHPINQYLASLIGPRGFGLVVMENI